MAKEALWKSIGREYYNIKKNYPKMLEMERASFLSDI